MVSVDNNEAVPRADRAVAMAPDPVSSLVGTSDCEKGEATVRCLVFRLLLVDLPPRQEVTLP